MERAAELRAALVRRSLAGSAGAAGAAGVADAAGVAEAVGVAGAVGAAGAAAAIGAGAATGAGATTGWAAGLETRKLSRISANSMCRRGLTLALYPDSH